MTASPTWRRWWGIEAMAGMGNEDPFPPPNLNAGCGFSQQTFAGANGKDGDAPIADVA
jgi:hypothetical protein